jgi:multisubunit Na+/H+ antiporter MnhC subunit
VSALEITFIVLFLLIGLFVVTATVLVPVVWTLLFIHQAVRRMIEK